MLGNIVRRIFGSANDRLIKGMAETVEKINDLEKVYLTLSDDGLKEQTNILKSRLKAGESLDDILVNAFAIVREASKRTLGLRPFDVQLMAGIVLHKGQIAEMKTGEGKTLAAVLPVYLNALTGKGVHVVTVNDYLAKTHSEMMGKIYKFLGLTVGCVLNGMDDNQRKAAYACDVTYGTNSEFGFDYLRDNLKVNTEQLCQREFYYAIVDEVDSILIDEARTPLIISGSTDDNSQLYSDVNQIVKDIEDNLCKIDEKDRTVCLTEEGMEKVEKILQDAGLVASGESLYNIKYMNLIHHINQSLKAYKLFKNETDYTVKNGQVYLVDEFTGRILEGRRFSDGLHQALEAKEGVQIQNENQTLASVTYQNYFRMYPKLAGMTGTALTEAVEFEQIYNLRTVAIPTNLPVIRKDLDDVIYRTEAEKYKAIVEKIKECHAKQQPILVGTVSIERSEYLSGLLKKENLKHNVLNAKYHEKEAYIIAQAGKAGAITIATNMAGRGTDIKLGGTDEFEVENILNDTSMTQEEKAIKIKLLDDEIKANKEIVLKAGGLFVLGTERHESRRIDNQLRGRSGRQGDPGVSQFFISLQDDLMRIFGTDKLSGLLVRLGLKEGEAIIHPLISKSLSRAQKKVENMHYEMRKNVLKYDDVVNMQRKVIFELRKDIMFAEDVSEEIDYITNERNQKLLQACFSEKDKKLDIARLNTELQANYGFTLEKGEVEPKPDVKKLGLILSNKLNDILTEKKTLYGEDVFKRMQRTIFLLTIDRLWKNHLNSLDQVRRSINLRAYGQKDPLVEYKKEAYYLFEDLMSKINIETISIIFRLKLDMTYLSKKEDEAQSEVFNITNQELVENRQDLARTISELNRANAKTLEAANRNVTRKQETVVSRKRTVATDYNTLDNWGRIGRNEKCPCGSGKKYKYCCGKLKS